MKTYAQVQTSLTNWQTAFGTLLTKLDSDAGVTQADFATSCALVDPKEPNECAQKFNALLAKLDVDAGADAEDYRAKCTVNFQAAQSISILDQVDQLTRHLGGLASKLNEDVGVSDQNYAG